jgi:hypothetical protein
MGRKSPLWKILDISGLAVGIGAICISLLDSLGVTEIIPDEWYPVVTVVLLSALTLYVILERRLVLDTLADRVDELSRGSAVEIASTRGQTYQCMIEAASEGTRLNPIRCVRIYAPVGFSLVDEDKQHWLEFLRQLVIDRKITDVEAIYGIPEDKVSLVKAANFLMQFFYYGGNNDDEQSTLLRNHMFVCGTMLGGAGLGLPRGFGVVTIGDKLLMIGYAISRGDEYVQKALVIRNKEAIRDINDWFDSHVYMGRGIKVLQGPITPERKLRLDKELRRILQDRGIPDSAIGKILNNRVISYEEIEAMNV